MARRHLVGIDYFVELVGVDPRRQRRLAERRSLVVCLWAIAEALR